MALHADRNLYQGINAHLQSIFQSDVSGWQSFHGDYITMLRTALDSQLPTGYLAISEESLQIRAFDLTEDTETVSQTRADVAVYQTGPTEASSPIAVAVSPTSTLALTQTVVEKVEEERLHALIIYRAMSDNVRGEAVTRIEVLSPANKSGGSHAQQYQAKRLETLRAGLNLIEIDLLHQTPSVILGVPNYPQEAGSFPYSIIVSDPRPSFDEGKVDFYGFHVDQPVPKIKIPLAGEDTLTFDFGAVYDEVFAGYRLARTLVDYSQLPPGFDRYSPDDQKRIWQRMEAAQASE